MIYIIGHTNNITSTIKDLINDYPYLYNYINTKELYKINNDDIILKMEPYINEFVAQYAIAKYVKPDMIYGFCHYRRIINATDIDFNNIIKNYSTQVFTCSFHFFKKYMEITLQENNVEYELMHTYFVHQFGLKYIYDEFCEFMHMQPESLQTSFKEAMRITQLVDINDKQNTLYMLVREIYVTAYINLQNMINFITSFMIFILNKHKCETIEDFDKYMNENLYDIVDVNSICEEYNWFNENTYHHKRAYGFFIEFLIGLWFYTQTKTIYTQLYPSHWVTMN